MILVRPESPADIATVRAVTIAAFGREDEADLLDELRSDGDLMFNGGAGAFHFAPAFDRH